MHEWVIHAHSDAAQKLVAVVLAFVVGFGIVGCKADEGADTAKEVVCEMVVPVVDKTGGCTGPSTPKSSGSTTPSSTRSTSGSSTLTS